MKRVNNNIKFYTFIDILRTYSDENVSLSIREIQHHIKKRLGVMIDRRTIYSYIKDMKALGMDVSDYDKSKEGYYLSSNYFNVEEIRVLADAVLTSNFITKDKTIELLDKLKAFNSIYQNKEFLRDIFVEDIPKSINGEVFGNMSKISEAIKLDRKICFNYCDYDYCRRLIHRVDDSGMPMIYKKNPAYVVLRSDNYYLICMDEESQTLEYFSIDRMLNVSVAYDEGIDGLFRIENLRNSLNSMEYLTKNVSLFPGEEIIVVVQFKKKVLNSILEKMGDYIYIMEKDNYKNNNLGEDIKEEHFHFQVLRKILGNKGYNEYILSGKYIENSQIREKFESFKSILSSFIHNSKNQINLHHKKISNKSEIQVDKPQPESTYIGIFVAKQSEKLTKYIMNFGADMKVVWPQTLKENIKDEISALKQLYIDDNDLSL